MKSRQVLVRATEIVVFLFAAFGGFLKGVAPPEDAGKAFSVGIASMLALCVFLLISAQAKRRAGVKARQWWLRGAAALTLAAAAAGMIYAHNLNRLSFPYPPENPDSEYIGGTEYTPEARTLAIQDHLNSAEIVARFGGLLNRQLVWPDSSMEKARMILQLNYLLLVLSLAGAIFSLIETRT
jgi:hypothetical protein